MFQLKENDKGYLVYLNKLNNSIQIDNPEFVRLMNRIGDSYCFVKYATYRCASKFNSLQAAFYSNTNKNHNFYLKTHMINHFYSQLHSICIGIIYFG